MFKILHFTKLTGICRIFEYFLTSFCRSSLSPTWTLLKKIWGTVLHPVSSFSRALSSGSLPTSMSHTGTSKSLRVALACAHCGQPSIEYTVTRPGVLLSNSPICSNKDKTVKGFKLQMRRENQLCFRGFLWFSVLHVQLDSSSLVLMTQSFVHYNSFSLLVSEYKYSSCWFQLVNILTSLLKNCIMNNYHAL